MKSADLHRHFWRNRKARSLTDAEHRVYTSLIAYCADQENDGRLTLGDLADVCTQQGLHGREREIADGLAAKAALDPGDQDGVWHLHHWLEHQPSVAELGAYRAKMAELGRRGGIRSGEVRAPTKRSAKRPLQVASEATDEAPASSGHEADGEAPASEAENEAHREAHREAKREATRSNPALPCPARPGPLGAGGRAVGVDRTTPAHATAPPSSDGPQRAPSSGGAREPEVRGEGFVPPVLRGRALSLAETVARAELLDPTRMRRTRDEGRDVLAEACLVLDERAAHVAPAQAQTLDRTAASSAIADVKRRASAAATKAQPHDDDPEERRAIAGENGDFDLDAPTAPGEDVGA